MKRLFALVFVLACITFAIAEDYVTLIHKKDGSVVAVRVDETDSITFTAGEFPADWFSISDTIIINDTVLKTLLVHDTIFFQIHDTISVEKPIWVHDTLYVDRIVHDTIYVTNPEVTEKKTYTINGVEYPMPEAVDLGLPSGNLWASFNIGSSSITDGGLLFIYGDISPSSGDYSNEELMNELIQLSNDKEVDIAKSKFDAAYNLLGSDWCLPNRNDFEELTQNCSLRIINYSENLYKLVGPNNNYIIFSAKYPYNQYVSSTYSAYKYFRKYPDPEYDGYMEYRGNISIFEVTGKYLDNPDFREYMSYYKYPIRPIKKAR